MLPKDPMKVERVIDLLNEAIPLVMRSAALYTWIAGTATGFEFQAVAEKLNGFGSLELDDARRLIEKSVALGGSPVSAVASFEPVPAGKPGVQQIIDYENEALGALHQIIPESGQEPRSEALEHLLEHIIMRKQEQVDFLERVRRG